MNLQNKKIAVLFVVIFLFVGGTSWFYCKVAKNKQQYLPITYGVPSPIAPPLGSATATPYIKSLEIGEYAGIISSSTVKNQNLYTNEKYGFQISYPQGYVMGDNMLGYPVDGKEELGQLWLFNPASDYGNNGAIGMNIMHSKEYSLENTDKVIMKKQISVAGQPVYVYDVEQHFAESEGYRFLLYVIPLPSHHDKYLWIKFHGNLSKLLTPDEIVKNIQWLPVENK